MNRVRLDGILDVVGAKGKVSLHSQVITYQLIYFLKFSFSSKPFSKCSFLNESTTFHFEMSRANPIRTHFHMKGYVKGLVFKQR